MSYKVSIIIPLYNSELYIERAINSVLSQTEQDFEIIIIDDGSTDNSYNMVKNYHDPRINIYKQIHSGVSKARNLGVEKSKSDFITFLDSDDEWNNDHLETIFYLKKKYPQAGLYFTNIEFKTNKKSRINSNYNNSIKDDILIVNLFEYILRGNIFIATASVGLEKRIFNQMNGFAVAQWGEDQDLWNRIALKYPVAYSPVKSIIGERSGDWVARQLKRVLVTPEHPFIINGKKALNDDVPDFLKNDLKEVVALYQIKSADYHMQLGNFETARKILNNCETIRFRWRKRYMYCWVNFPIPYLGAKSYNLFYSAISYVYNIFYKIARA